MRREVAGVAEIERPAATPERPLHVLHVFASLDRGGAEVRTLELIRQLDAREVRFSFLLLSGRPGAMAEDARAVGASIHPLALGRGFGRGLRQLIATERFDVVHSHTHYFSGYILRQAARMGVRGRIAHFRSTSDGQPDSLRRAWQRRIMRHWIDRHATTIAAVSRSAMEGAWGADWLRDPRCRVLYNGLDIRPYHAPEDRLGVRAEFGLPSTARLLIHVGSLQPVKNHRHLLNVFEAVARRHDEVRLLIVGRDLGLGDEIRRQIASLNLTGRVVMAGERTDVPRLLKASDGFVFPSVREGLPGAVLEACAAGLPVIGSSIPPLQEVAGHFPSVRCVSLDAPMSAWIDAADDLLRQEVHPAVRHAAANVFTRSPFDLGQAARAYLDVLSGSALSLQS